MEARSENTDFTMRNVFIALAAILLASRLLLAQEPKVSEQPSSPTGDADRAPQEGSLGAKTLLSPPMGIADAIRTEQESSLFPGPNDLSGSRDLFWAQA